MKVMGLFVSMDDMLGSDYARGLATLKQKIEDGGGSTAQ